MPKTKTRINAQVHWILWIARRTFVRRSSEGSFEAAQVASDTLLAPFGEVLIRILFIGKRLARRMGWTLSCIEHSHQLLTKFFLHNEDFQPEVCKHW